MDSDLETLRAVFASRVQFAKKTVEEALEDARKEHRNVLDWVRSNSTKEGSFCWYCDVCKVLIARISEVGELNIFAC
jgi:xanthine dehydrogenase iron-sulfur cluster and FAD-binding subunit A